MNTEELTVEPLISYEQLAFAVEAFLLGLAIFIAGCYLYEYLLPPFMRWIRSLFVLGSDKIEVPVWNFETEPISHVRIIDNPLVNTINTPYDWAQEEDNDYTN